MKQQQNNNDKQNSKTINCNAGSKKYRIEIISPHKYCKYIHTKVDVEFANRKSALEWVGNIVGGTIKDSVRHVKANGIHGPFVIEIISERETWHIPFSIVAGKFQYELTDEEAGIAEEWMK